MAFDKKAYMKEYLRQPKRKQYMKDYRKQRNERIEMALQLLKEKEDKKV